MEILIGVALGFTFIVISLAMYYNSSQSHKLKIAKLLARNQELGMKISELKAEIEALKSEKCAFSAVPDFPQAAPMDEAAPPPRPSRPPVSVVVTLMREGHVTQEQVRKAEQYQRDNASPYALEEILMLLNMVAPAVVSEIRARENAL